MRGSNVALAKSNVSNVSIVSSYRRVIQSCYRASPAAVLDSFASSDRGRGVTMGPGGWLSWRSREGCLLSRYSTDPYSYSITLLARYPRLASIILSLGSQSVGTVDPRSTRRRIIFPSQPMLRTINPGSGTVLSSSSSVRNIEVAADGAAGAGRSPWRGHQLVLSTCTLSVDSSQPDDTPPGLATSWSQQKLSQRSILSRSYLAAWTLQPKPSTNSVLPEETSPGLGHARSSTYICTAPTLHPILYCSAWTR